jgi:hypothetical protein
VRRRTSVVAGVVLLAGCGGSGSPQPLSHDEYQAKIQAIVLGAAPAGRLFSDVVYQSAEHPKTVAECGRKTAQLRDELQRIVDDVDALDPPADAAELQRRFVANARVSVASVGRAADAAARGDVHCGGEMNRRIYGLPSTERAQAAITELEQRGYRVFFE